MEKVGMIGEATEQREMQCKGEGIQMGFFQTIEYGQSIEHPS